MKCLIAGLCVLLASCEYQPADAAGRSVIGADWIEITSHYALPKPMAECKVYRLKSSDNSNHQSLYTIHCPDATASTDWQNGKVRNNVSVI